MPRGIWHRRRPMSTKSRRYAVDFPPEDIRLRVQTQLRRLGANTLAAELGLSRNTTLSLAAGARTLPGTLALVRERLPQLEQGSETGDS